MLRKRQKYPKRGNLRAAVPVITGIKKPYMKILRVAFLLLNATLAFGQGPAVKDKLLITANTFLEVYNTGDSLAYRKFLAGSWHDEKQLNQKLRGYLNAWSMIGKVDVKQVTPVGFDRVELLTRDKQFDAWWKFVVHTDSSQQYRDRFILPAGLTTAFLQPGSLSAVEVAEQTDQYIRKQLGNHFSGNVYIGKGAEIILSRSYGRQAQQDAQPARRLFGLASMGKLFTTVSILQLAEKGVLSLEDTVGRFLPGKTSAAIAAINIRQLLTHTSGMGDFFGNPVYEKIKDSIKSELDMLPVVRSEPLRFKPGSSWSYSNAGFSVLGMIIETLTGSSFGQHLQQHIFEPAAMKTARAGSAAGGGEASIDDLRAFSEALLGNRLLSATSMKELLSYTVNDGRYGLGSEHHALGKDYIFGHSGGYINVCTELNLYLQSGHTVIILSDSNPPYGHFLSNKIKELLVRQD